MTDDRRYRSISRGFAELVQQLAIDPLFTFDVVVVGSGYGAAAAAHTFATRTKAGNVPVSVCVLERGNEYLPGMFPARFAELPGHLRYSLPSGSRNNAGLFDIRFSPTVTTVVANGVGGGSLINAGVMERPADGVFAQGWPAALNAAALAPHYVRAQALLGAQPFDDARPDADLPRKFRTLRDLDPGNHRAALITVAQQDGEEASGGFAMNGCLECGDCATGCNHNAKISLDVSLLGRAARRPNCAVYTGATVLNLEHGAGSWRVNCVYTDENLRKRHGAIIPVNARHVVLAAGTLGSVEILERSTGVPVSERLGERASTNGDMIVADYHADAADPEVNAVADEAQSPADRHVGPTITGIIDWRGVADRPDLVIEDMAVPGPLRRVFRELYATVNTIHAMADGDCARHHQGFPQADDIYAVDDRPLERTGVYAVMGDDRIGGATVSVSVEVPEGDDAEYHDGIAVLASDDLAGSGVFEEQIDGIEEHLQWTGGGRRIPNPAWRLLPESLQWLMGQRFGPLVTVHPLGGCVMADSRELGVVDEAGRVFNPGAAALDATYDGLAVLDGSVIPTALGTNPALTITAVALRGAASLAGGWGYAADADDDPGAQVRTPYRAVADGFASAPTEVEVLERLSGPVRFRTLGEPYPRTRIVELTLVFQAAALDALMRTSGDPRAGAGARPELRLDPARSRMRIFEPHDWQQIQRANLPEPEVEARLDAAARLSAGLRGRLIVFERLHSFGFWRVARGTVAWLLNRGLRDIWQSLGTPAPPSDPGVWQKVRALLAVASRAGEKRALRYQLEVVAAEGELALRGDRLQGIKTFTYGWRANPWNQLIEVTLRRFPGRCRLSRPRVLRVDLPFFVRRGVPLFQITRQQDAASGLADVAAFFAYLIRLLVGMHLWTFRLPDPDPRVDADIRRLPQNMPGLPPREIYDIPIGLDVVRLTRYPARGSPYPPLLMIHGYSIGGTTFAHHAVEPNAARFFHARGRDVWIVDMRTSPGQNSATKPWTFEDIAMVDIPLAVERIVNVTGAATVDVLAHCMGAAMFSMAVLRDLPGQELARTVDPAVEQALLDLPGRINRVVLSQIAPLMMLSPANLFRGYVTRYLLDFLPLGAYAFRPEDPDSFGNQLLDRLLASLPYPRKEFTYENPLQFWRQTPWVRTRHRMDVLYGRGLEVRNLPRKVLAYLDDFCGPMNLRTVSQTLHFARVHSVANREGRNRYVARDRMDQWPFHTFSIHSENNGLADVKTVYRMDDVFSGRLGRRYEYWVQPDAGHLDWLIGTPQVPVFEKILAFLDEADKGPAREPEDGYIALPPWIGPILSTIERDGSADRVFVRLGSRPSLDKAIGVVFLPLNPGQPPNVLADMVYVPSADLEAHDWATVEVPPDVLPEPGGSLLVLIVFPEVSGIGLRTLKDGDYTFVDVAAGEVLSYRLRNGKPTNPQTAAVALEEVVAVSDAVELALQDQQPAPPPPGRISRLHRTGSEDHRRLVRAVSDTLETPAPQLQDGLVEYDRDDRDEQVTEFALGSCQFPAGLIDEPVAGASYRRLLGRLQSPQAGAIRPRFVLLAGDQVYTDIRAGLYDPTQQDDRFSSPYQRWLRMRPVRDVFRHVPSTMTLDDHELDDNWEPIAPGAPPAMVAVHDALREDGLAAYRKFQRPSVVPPIPIWQQHDLKGARLFLMDTRSKRARRTAPTLDTAATGLVDQPQWDALQAWLAGNAAEPKFVVSPSMLFPRLLRIADPQAVASEALCSDRWDGYPYTLRALVRMLADAVQPISNLVFLSGDEHRACIAAVAVFKSGQPVCTFHSVHTPGLHAPFPSGNALPETFRYAESFEFDEYRCEIDARFPGPEDYNGFTYLALQGSAVAGWSLRVEYDGIPGELLAL